MKIKTPEIISPKIILGIDPGTNFLGYGIIKSQGSSIELIDLGVFSPPKGSSDEDKLSFIFRSVTNIIISHEPSCMAIELPFFAKNPQSMLKLGRAQGVAIAAGMQQGLLIAEYGAKKIKQSVTGNGNASKEQVAALVQYHLKTVIPKTRLDATDALAIAICHQIQLGSPFANIKGKKNWDSFIKENPDRVKGP
jgi:crossover junction endodeoxyribonuclease RuvC